MSPNTSAVDLRVRRTRKLLRTALVELIEERGFEALKIVDIAERAMINRATFYRHYKDKYDLLMHCMDDVFVELEAHIEPPRSDAGELNHNAPLANLEAMLDHVIEHADFYRVMLSKDGAGAFVSRLRAYLRVFATNRWQEIAGESDGPDMPPDLIISFIASAYIGAIVWWVENDFAGTAAQMAQRLHILTIEGPYKAFGLELPDSRAVSA